MMGNYRPGIDEPELEGMPARDPEVVKKEQRALLEAELRGWWAGQATREADAVAPKAIEYSAYDLPLIGQITADMIGWEGERTDAVFAEIGCWWYAIGKMGRAVGALREGRIPSDDTVHDLNVYGRMIARIRETGGWPGV